MKCPRCGFCDDDDERDLDERAERLAEQIRAAGHWVSFDRRVSERTAAQLLGRSETTLRHWRSKGVIVAVMVRGRATYRLRDLLQFMDDDGEK